MSHRRVTTPRDDVRTGGDRPLQSLCLVITDRHTGEIGSSHPKLATTSWLIVIFGECQLIA
jgi:hypothetical protein